MRVSILAASVLVLLNAACGSDPEGSAPSQGTPPGSDAGATSDAGAKPSGDDAAAPPADSGVPPEADAATQDGPDAEAPPPDSGNPALDKACTPTTAVFQQVEPTASKVFTDNIPDPEAFIKEAAHRVCTVLYKNASEVRSIDTVTLIIKSSPGDVADTGGETTRFYSEYINDFAKSHTSAETLFELKGVVHHEFTHIYQNFGGDFPIVEGMADYVRFRSGFIPATNRGHGGKWDDGYQTTAFFFVYCDDTYKDFGYKLNQAAAAWPANNAAFNTITGKNVDTLWSDYQASF